MVFREVNRLTNMICRNQPTNLVQRDLKQLVDKGLCTETASNTPTPPSIIC